MPALDPNRSMVNDPFSGTSIRYRLRKYRRMENKKSRQGAEPAIPTSSPTPIVITLETYELREKEK